MKSGHTTTVFHKVKRIAGVPIKTVFVLVMLIVLVTAFPACKNKNDTPVDPDIYYTCSMDPQVVESKPGICPICKMDLTPVKKSKGQNRDELQLSDQQIQLGNIQTDTIKNDSIGSEWVLTATLSFDQEQSFSVSSRVMGRVERLYFKNVGDYVKKGVPLFTIYSEDLNNAKQEYLLALERKESFATGAIIDVDQLVQSARNKLMLWGMNEEQLSELTKTGKATPTTTFYSPVAGFITQLDIREGDYVMEGGVVVKLADLSTLWAEAQVYASQLADIDQKSTAVVLFPDQADKSISGRIEFVNPEIATDTRINLIRVAIPNSGNQLKPGMPAYVRLKSPPKKGITLPIDAVIRDAKGAMVWLQTGTNIFRSRMVETGVENNDRIEIRSGLQPGDVVVLSGAYLINSEYQFKKGSDPMADHQH